MIETYDNVGAVVKVQDLIDAIGNEDFDKELFNVLKRYIKAIGYKKRLDEDQEKFNQDEAWIIEMGFLKNALNRSEISRDTYVLFEYMLPNENTSRPDLIFLNKGKVSIFELKTKGKKVKNGYVTQFVDYRKTILGYHDESAGLSVESFLVMCSINDNEIVKAWQEDKIDETDRKRIIGKDGFIQALNSLKDLKPMTHADAITWINSKMTPGKSVSEKSKNIKKELLKGIDGYYSKVSDVPIEDIHEPIDAVFELLNEKGKKIVFISGVPGAGKTLVGMFILFGALGIKDSDGRSKKPARYYTGNGALRNVLAKTLDSKSDIASITSFRTYHVFKQKSCDEEVLIFDEAQRFWSVDRITRAMTIEYSDDSKRTEVKKAYNDYINAGNSIMSDAESIVNAKYTKNNVTIICLIGDGQKPMYGEAGIEAWADALKKNGTWKVYIPEEQKEHFSGVNYTCDYKDKENNIYKLHLSVAQRTHFINTSPWVEAVLSGDLDEAKNEVKKFKEGNNKFNLKITRSLGDLYKVGSDGKTYLEKYKQEKEESSKTDKKFLYGVLCSSNRYSIERNDANRFTITKVSRLSEGVLHEDYNEETHRYENSNMYIENDKAYDWYNGLCCDREVKAATETFCQGLEVDLPIVFFKGDFLLKRKNGVYNWVVNISKGAKKTLGKDYYKRIEDSYRILLTRATEEMILVIPDNPAFNDLYNFMKDSGIDVLS